MGENLAVEFFDVSDPKVAAAHRNVLESVARHRLEYPLVAVNGEFRYSGAISYPSILRDLRRIRGAADASDRP